LAGGQHELLEHDLGVEVGDGVARVEDEDAARVDLADDLGPIFKIRFDRDLQTNCS
jgi:hypothetical protein